MANNRLVFDFKQIREELRKLPTELRDDGGRIVEARGNEAGREIVDKYATVSGNLKDGVKVTVQRAGQFGVQVTVRSTSPHAFIYENGTQIRRNAKGANRGAMPPKHVLVPVMVRKRRQAYEDLANLLRANGLLVSGTP